MTDTTRRFPTCSRQPRRCAEGTVDPQQPDPEFICTICRHSGRQCDAALMMARDLARAGAAACAVDIGFEMTGFTRLEGCARACPALFVVSQRGVELYCGAEAGEDLHALAAFARGFLCTEPAAPQPVSLEEPPLAFVVGPVRQVLEDVPGLCN